MKKILALLLVFSICVTLCACAEGADITNADTKSADITNAGTKSAAAKKVDDQILAIGDVTRGSKVAIDAASNSYNALTEEEKNTIENLDMLKEAQISYLKILIASITDLSLSGKETLQQARSYYDSLSPEQKEKANCQAEIEKLEADYAKWTAKREAFEELKELIRTKGTAIKAGGVNNSDTIVKWVCDGIVLSNQSFNKGDISYDITMDIENTDDFWIGRTWYYPETWINVSIDEDHFDIIFSSSFHAYASMDDIKLALGAMEEIRFEDYSINGKLPDITDYSSDQTAMIRYDAPFDTDAEYGEYIRGCIHDQICVILSTFKTELGFDITKLGFSEDVAKGIA